MNKSMPIKNPKISIIIPVFNVEGYLPKCILSVINQRYINLEIILVDDGSNDRSVEICNDYAGTDNRIVVLHKENGGVSDARNAGMEIATGEYVCFLDSDDYVENDLIEQAVDKINKYDCDVVVWGFYADFVDNQEKLLKSKVNIPSVKGLYSRESIKNIEIDSNLVKILGYVWNKMYRNDILKKNELQFQKEITLFEDILFNTSVLAVTESFFFINKPYIHYMQRPMVTLGKKFYSNNFELKMNVLNALEKLYSTWGLEQNLIRNEITILGFRYLTGAVKNISKSEMIIFSEKGKLLKNILNKPETVTILKNFKPNNPFNYLLKFLLRHHQTMALIVSFKFIFGLMYSINIIKSKTHHFLK